MSTEAAHLEQRDLHSSASAAVSPSADAVTDTRIAVDHDLLSLRSVLTTLDGIMVVQGSSTARRNLVLHVREQVPALALHITLRGTARLGIGGRAAGEAVRAGEWLVFGGQDAYDVTMDGGVANRGLRINFTRRYVDGLLERCPELGDCEPAGLVSGRVPGVLTAEPMPLGALADLVEDVRQSDRYGSLRRLFLESTALSMLARALSGRRIEQRSLRVRDRERMLEARDRLIASMRTPPTLPVLARMVGTNEFRLKRDFKIMFGEPVHAFLLRRRLEHARAQLLDRDRSVKEIAAEIGYAHVSHFSAAFRKRFGVPPTAMRR
jgi:AraC-like DNA-binding protein